MDKNKIIELHSREDLIQFLNTIEEDTIFKITIETIAFEEADEILNNDKS